MAELTQKKTSTINTITVPSPSPPPPPPPPPYKPKSTTGTSFLGCFGFSRKSRNISTRGSKSSLVKQETSYIRSDRLHHEDRKINMKRSRDRRWSLIPRSSWFGTNKKSAAKTVPIVDPSGTVTPKKERPSKVNVKFSSDTTKSTSKSKPNKLADPDGPPSPAVLDGHTTPPTPKPPQTSNTINLENRIHLEPSEDATCQNRLSFCRKIDSIRTKATTPRSAGGGRKGGGVFGSQNQPGSPPVQEEKKTKSTTRTTTAAAPKLSNSVSFDLQIAGPAAVAAAGPTATPSAHNNNNWQQSSWSPWSNGVSKTAPSINKKVDPLVGMSIIMVTLIIMLVWGRLCAILCTSAWFYFLPRLRSSGVPAFGAAHESAAAGGRLINPRDLDFISSEEYKKKVVLEGFLERTRRNIT